MNLQINEKAFSFKYALFYTIVIFIILLFPLLIYTNYSYNLEEAKTEIALKKTSIEIINEMETFDSNKKEVFIFPRFKSFKAGLYDENLNDIFTLISDENLPLYLGEGYHKVEDQRIYNITFENRRYFGAHHLIVVTQFDTFSILKNILIVMSFIVIITFLLSWLILKNFARPFREINNSLDTFIKDSMHEINTPLSIININVDMYNEKFGKNRYFSRIKSASKILSSIYNDMNYLIKENSIEKASKETIDFSFFLRKSIDYFLDIAELKGIKLVPKIQEAILIEFVPAKLQKIIDNTLSNAIKYGKEEKNVIVKLYKVENKIVLSIQDFGIGMKDPDKIFSRYYREDHTKGGFGIGLNIVKKIINDEDIKVKVDSILDEGSTFEYTFTLS